MSELKIITKESDIDDLEFGDSFIIKIPGLPDDPIELIESDEWAEAERLQKLIEIKFSNSDESPPPVGPRPIEASLDLGADSITIVITNNTAMPVKVHFKIDPGRDRTNTIVANKSKTTKLEKLTEETLVEVRTDDINGELLARTVFVPV